MLSSNFIFSEKRKDRIRRHLFFWTIYGAYYMSQHIASSFLPPESSYFNNIPFSFSEIFILLILQVSVIYTTLYFILPIYTRDRKLLKAITWFVACWSVYFLVSSYMITSGIPKILNEILPEKYLRHTQRSPDVSSYLNLLSVFLGSLGSTVIVAGIKYVKQWYLKQQRNTQLQKENMESQLQLLTAQVHPHFLFNTLNNIYSQTQTESPKGSKMIMGLSDMLRYILYEGQKPLVPLKQELLMITEYINLEKIRYGNKLDVHVLMPDKTDDIYIAPLLLLPFVENCFKHGTSNILQNPWINLTVELKDTRLVMKLMNGKTSQNGNIQNKQGIGINNASQRLNLLYKDKFELQVREEEEVFVVDLKVELTRIKNKEQENTTLQSEQTRVYA